MRNGSRCGRGCDDAPVAAPSAGRAETQANSAWQALALGVQPKLTVSRPHDPAEQEADRVAERVAGDGGADALAVHTASSPISRMCATCEDEEQDDVVHAKESSGSPSAGAGATNAVATATQGGGEPLSGEARSYFEPRFGHDLGDVRIHTGGEAAGAAKGINARAYTYGEDIVFGAGEYSTETVDGRKLIAHELTHVLQQRGRGDGVLARASFGEMWDAVWGVGPVDSWRASTIADEALLAARNTGLPGIEDGPADAWRHCFWNCSMTHALGYDQAETIANNHETHGTTGSAASHQMDYFNNDVGRNCGGDECDTCCQTALDSGRLRVIDATGAVVPSTATPRTGGTQAGTSYDESGYSRVPPAQRPPPPPPAPRESMRGCFTGAMPVTLSDGSSKPIARIAVGDRVLSFDESQRRVRVCKVTACHSHPPANYLEMNLAGGRRLEVTGNHELFVGDGWEAVEKLQAGSIVYSNDRGLEAEGLLPSSVDRIEAVAGAAPVFDITVDDCHNYFVNGVLAHNKVF